MKKYPLDMEGAKLEFKRYPKPHFPFQFPFRKWMDILTILTRNFILIMISILIKKEEGRRERLRKWSDNIRVIGEIYLGYSSLNDFTTVLKHLIFPVWLGGNGGTNRWRALPRHFWVERILTFMTLATWYLLIIPFLPITLKENRNKNRNKKLKSKLSGRRRCPNHVIHVYIVVR